MAVADRAGDAGARGAVSLRLGPGQTDKPRWRWVSPGAGAATVLWIVASVAFTVYVANFNSYDKTSDRGAAS
jgi:membrane protein